MIRSTPPTGGTQGKDLRRENMEVKKGNYLTGYRIKPNWLFVIDCP